MIDKYLDLTKKQKRLRNMKATLILIVVGVFGTVPKVLKKRLGELGTRGRIKTIKRY